VNRLRHRLIRFSTPIFLTRQYNTQRDTGLRHLACFSKENLHRTKNAMIFNRRTFYVHSLNIILRELGKKPAWLTISGVSGSRTERTDIWRKMCWARTGEPTGEESKARHGPCPQIHGKAGPDPIYSVRRKWRSQDKDSSRSRRTGSAICQDRCQKELLHSASSRAVE